MEFEKQETMKKILGLVFIIMIQCGCKKSNDNETINILDNCKREVSFEIENSTSQYSSSDSSETFIIDFAPISA